MTVQVVELVHGDGSKNYDVVVRCSDDQEKSQAVWLWCVDEESAEALADAIRDYAMDVRELARASQPY